MKPHEFHAKYANTPLKDRDILINARKYGRTLDLNKLFEEVKELEAKIRPHQVQLDWLMKIADEYLNQTLYPTKGEYKGSEKLNK